MFVPVSCTACGKPFQVPDAALGQLAPCPWCQAVVTALPVSAPLQPNANTTAPLTLDDEPPARPVTAAPAVPPPAAGKTLTRATLLIGFLVVVVVMGVTLLVRGYGGGRLSADGWTEFTPADGSFTVALPGAPAEEDVGANPDGSVTGGKRYSVRGWYSKTRAWVAYTDLTPALAQKLPSDKDRVVTAGVLRVERDREVTRLNGTITKEAEMRFGSAWGVELHMDTPTGNVVERLILAGDGPRPRLYVYGVEGKNLTPTSPPCTKLFKSFRVNE